MLSGRVGAGAIAEKWLRIRFNIQIVAFVSAVGSVQFDFDDQLLESLQREAVDNSVVRCPRAPVAAEMVKVLGHFMRATVGLGLICFVLRCVVQNML